MRLTPIGVRTCTSLEQGGVLEMSRGLGEDPVKDPDRVSGSPQGEMQFSLGEISDPLSERGRAFPSLSSEDRATSPALSGD